MRIVVLRIVFRGHRAEDRFGVGTGQRAHRVGDIRKRRALRSVEKLLGVERSGRDDHLICGEGALTRAERTPRRRAPGVDLPRPVGTLRESVDGGAVDDRCSVALGETEVVLHQGVLRAHPAAGHARPALGAGGPLGSGSTEIRVRHGLARHSRQAGLGTEEHSDRRRGEGVGRAHLFGDGTHHPIRFCDSGIGDDAQHPSRLLVMRCELGLPVGDVVPLGIGEERSRRLVQGVGVVERATADARSRHDHHVFECVDALNPVQPELRRPEPLVETPTRLGELVVFEPTSGFDHPDAVPLLDEAQRTDAAAETGTDDEHVEVRLILALVERVVALVERVLALVELVLALVELVETMVGCHSQPF